MATDNFELLTNNEYLTDLIEQIVELANSERNALGFLPPAAYKSAIDRSRLIALVCNESGHNDLAGFILFSGVKTSAKIQQIATHRNFRRRGVARALMRSLIDLLERKNYLSVQADVASDLDQARAFYESNGFEVVSEKPGGASRGRTILVHARYLETPSLFSYGDNSGAILDWSLPNSLDMTARTFALDVMVYIDLVKDRGFQRFAEVLFRSALSHEIRIAIADEFCAELRRAGKNLESDPLYNMALQLPHLPPVDESHHREISDRVYDAVFVDSRVRGFGKPNSKRDANHLAHAALAGADAFVTRDSSILNASDTLLEEFGLDVLSPEELVAYLPKNLKTPNSNSEGDGFTLKPIEVGVAQKYFDDPATKTSHTTHLQNFDFGSEIAICRSIEVDRTIKACAVLITPRHTSPVSKVLIHVRPEAIGGQLYVEALLQECLSACAKSAVSTIQVFDLPGQTMVRALLKDAGFIKNSDRETYDKIVVGKPVTPSAWESLVSETRRRTGIYLPDQFPSFASSWMGTIANSNGQSSEINFEQLEALIGPVLIGAKDRPAVVVPIRRGYSEMLLGEKSQMSLGLVEKKDAQFRRLRAYIGAAKRPTIFEKGGLIFFYESLKNNGAGGIVAVARIVDSLLASKVGDEDLGRIVVDDPNKFSQSDRVMITRFDNICMLKVPVLFDKLKSMDIPDGTNFVTATKIDSMAAIKILEIGDAK